MIFCMSAKREPVTEDRLRNFKYFGKILPLLDRLHDAGTGRDKAGNRILHFDQYIALQRLFFFNPVISSLRGLVQASHPAQGPAGTRRFGDQSGQSQRGRQRL